MTAVSAFSSTRRGLQETRKIAALGQLRDAQHDRPGPCLPTAIAVAVALGETLGALFAVYRAVSAPTSNSINRLAAKPIIWCKTSVGSGRETRPPAMIQRRCETTRIRVELRKRANDVVERTRLRRRRRGFAATRNDVSPQPGHLTGHE